MQISSITKQFEIRVNGVIGFLLLAILTIELNCIDKERKHV